MNGPQPEAWGLDGVPHPLQGGARNQVFRLNGHVFKSTRRSEAALAWLGPVQTAARAAGFLVPRLLRSRRGRWSEQGWTCETFIEARPSERGNLTRIVGQMARFHTATRDMAQRPGFASALALLDSPSGGDVDLSALPPDLAEACRAAWWAVRQGPVTVVHGDLNPSNLLWNKDNQPVLLDWDECRRDLILFDQVPLSESGPAAEKAALAWEIACCWHVEPQRAKVLADVLLT